MSGRVPRAWLPWVLFRLTAGVSALLLALVLLAPLLDDAEAETTGSRSLLVLFARDATLRRTAIASALGLLVTAGVFFRPVEKSPPADSADRHSRQPPPPRGMAGA